MWEIPENLSDKSFFNDLNNFPDPVTNELKPPHNQSQDSGAEKVLEIDQDLVVVPKATCILTSHRSIVNNIAYHPNYPILCSSGVEKIIKGLCYHTGLLDRKF